MNNVRKVVGVLGGMGPYATLKFFENILQLTPAKKDWDHVRLIIDNNPHIPSRSRAILFNESSPVNGMIDSCKRLSSYPVDFIVLPCNSSCYFLPEIQKYVKTPILNIIDITSEMFHQKYPDIKKVTVLGGTVTYLKQTYREYLEKRGMELALHSDKIQDDVTKLIEEVKQNKNKKELVKSYTKIIHSLKQLSPGGVILACTELTYFKDIKVGIKVIDSSYALADYTVQIATGKKTLPFDTIKVHEFWKERAQMLVSHKVSDFQATLLTVDSKIAEERDSFEKHKLLSFIKKYKNHFKERAVEFGCGIGRLTEVLADYVNVVDAMDYCEEFIQVAKQNAVERDIKNTNYFVSSVENFKSEHKYDCALSAGLMIFLDDKQFAKLVHVIAKSLKKGAICFIRESVGYPKRFELHDFYSNAIKKEYNAVYRSSEEIIKEFSKHGFVLLEEEITIAPAIDKPETCQKIIVLEKLG